MLGSVAGGVAGQAAEEVGTRKTRLEITVKLDGGKLVAITQEADEAFRPGERVRISSPTAQHRALRSEARHGSPRSGRRKTVIPGA